MPANILIINIKSVGRPFHAVGIYCCLINQPLSTHSAVARLQFVID